MQKSALLETPAPAVVSPVRQVHALTGVRIIAAMWVVMFHVRGNIAAEFPWVNALIGPLLAHGELGVDLFFALSGYVLALNYGERMGLRLDRKSTAKFWWARLARVWPAYAFMLLFTAVWHGLLLSRSSPDPVIVRDYSVGSFLRQLTLVVQWTEPNFERLTWNGAAWSVSAEAFAYLLYPLIALFVFRLNRAFSTRALIGMAAAVLLPVVLFSYVLGLYGPWMWLLRILCAFIAGAVIFYIVRRIPDTARNRLLASHLILFAAAAVVVACYAMDLTNRSRYIGLLIPVLVLIVGALGMGDRHIARLLGTRAFVLGGMASYSIYLVHMPLVEIFWKMQMTFPGVLGAGTIGAKIGFVALPVVVSLFGYLLWRYFEEPARRKMRVMSTQQIPERAVDDPAVGHGELAPVTDRSRT